MQYAFYMNIHAALALCFVPLIVMFFFVRRFAQVGTIVCLYAVLLGLLAVAPISILQFYVADIPILNSNHWITQLLRAVLFNGLIEEFIKIIFIFFLPSKRLSLGNFFLCACICGMSLGCFESAIYFLQHLQQANTIGTHLIYVQIFTRMFTSDAVHTLCAGLGGLFIRSIKRMRIDIAAFLFAPLIHGLYDFFALYDDFKRFSVAALLFLVVQCRISYTSQAEEKIADEKTVQKTDVLKKTEKTLKKESERRKMSKETKVVEKSVKFGKTKDKESIEKKESVKRKPARKN